MSGNVWRLAGQLVLAVPDLVAVVRVDRTEVEVARDVLEVAAVLEPWSGHRDVVGRELALRLHEHGEVDVVLAVPGGERFEQLEAVAGRADDDLDVAAVGRRSGERVFARVVAGVGQDLADWARRALTSVPSGAVIVSVVGSKSSRPPSAIAMTVSGDVTKASVLAEPSLRFGKLRLNEVTIVLVSPVIASGRLHWPMHGPHALASTVAPIASRSASRPSRSIVARVCSEPGVIEQRHLGGEPGGGGLAGDRRGAGDVLVRRVGARSDQRGRRHERPVVRACGSAPTPAAPTRWARSGECGPLIKRLQLVEVDLDQLVVQRPVVGAQVVGDVVGGSRRSPRGRSP